MQKSHPLSSISTLFSLLLLNTALASSGPISGPIKVTTSDITGLTGWHITEGAFDFELNQITPDFVRAFYQARGFDSARADQIARSCVFQTVGKNSLDKKEHDTLRVDLRHWTMMLDGKEQSPKMKESWDAEWNDLDKAARLAFRWATFPTEQTFHPGGDYNWGMITMGVPAGTMFDLQLKWSQGEKERSLTVHNMRCAPDDPDSASE